MFDALIFKPIFNVLSGIYAVLPGHDFGLAIVLFTIAVRFAMWPLIKKQLHQTKIIRKLTPELKEIKKKNKGNKQAEMLATTELYKRYGVNPFMSIGLLIIQLPLFIGLYSSLNSIIKDPQVLVDRSYSFVENLPHIQEIAQSTDNFNPSFLGIVNVTDYALKNGVVWAALIIALLAGFFQFLTARQLQPQQPDGKKPKTLRQAIKEAQEKGEEPDLSEIQANTARRMGLLLPGLITFIAITLPAGLGIYFTASNAMGYLQQRRVLSQDAEEMSEMKITTTVKSGVSATKKKAAPRRKR